MLTKELGSLIAPMAGDGLYAKGVKARIPMTLVISMETEDLSETLRCVEFDSQGNISYIDGEFVAIFGGPSTKYCGANQHPYTDSGITTSINTFLRTLGYRKGTVGWSELGRQTTNGGDFDADYTLFEQVFPEFIAERRRLALDLSA